MTTPNGVPTTVCETRTAMSVRVANTPGSIVRVVTANKRHRCDGHMNPVSHHIEPGDNYVATALPPNHIDIGNLGWWHNRFCMDCCPVEFASSAKESA